MRSFTVVYGKLQLVSVSKAERQTGSDLYENFHPLGFWLTLLTDLRNVMVRQRTGFR